MVICHRVEQWKKAQNLYVKEHVFRKQTPKALNFTAMSQVFTSMLSIDK